MENIKVDRKEKSVAITKNGMASKIQKRKCPDCGRSWLCRIVSGRKKVHLQTFWPANKKDDRGMKPCCLKAVLAPG